MINHSFLWINNNKRKYHKITRQKLELENNTKYNSFLHNNLPGLITFQKLTIHHSSKNTPPLDKIFGMGDLSKSYTIV